MPELDDEELLALVMGARAPARAGKLLESGGGLRGLARAGDRELVRLGGLRGREAARVAAAFELARRLHAPAARPRVMHAGDIWQRLRGLVAGLEQEVFYVVALDTRNHVLAELEVARGTLAGVEVHPREVFRPLLRLSAASGVVAHNHPSGSPEPSTQDLELTQRLRAVGELIGIPILDHVVLGDGAYRSIAEVLGTGA